MTFDKLLKTLRKENNLSQDMLADTIGVTKTTISNWENNKSNPSVIDTEMMQNISSALGVEANLIVSSILEKSDTSLSTNESNVDNKYIKLIFPKFLHDRLLSLELSEIEIKVLLLRQMANNTNITLGINDYFNISSDLATISTAIRNIGQKTSELSERMVNVILEIIQDNHYTKFVFRKISNKDLRYFIKNTINPAFTEALKEINEGIPYLWDYEYFYIIKDIEEKEFSVTVNKRHSFPDTKPGQTVTFKFPKKYLLKYNHDHRSDNFDDVTVLIDEKQIQRTVQMNNKCIATLCYTSLDYRNWIDSVVGMPEEYKFFVSYKDDCSESKEPEASKPCKSAVLTESGKVLLEFLSDTSCDV